MHDDVDYAALMQGDDDEYEAQTRELLRPGSGFRVEWREATGFPTGRPPAFEDGVPASVVEAVVARVNVTPATFRMLTKPGRPSAAAAPLRDALAIRIADVMDSGRGLGIEDALIAAYGCDRSTLYKLAERGRNRD